MKYVVLGIQIQDYISKKTSQPVKGVSLHCAYNDSQVDGQAVDSLFIGERLDCYPKLLHIKPGALVDVEFNRRGYIADVSIVSDGYASAPASGSAPAPAPAGAPPSSKK